MQCWRSRVLCWVSVVVGVLVVLVGLWWLVVWTFSSDWGVGFCDEGFYLLAADFFTWIVCWVMLFGWHIALFFCLFGYDIARLWTFVVWVLVFDGAAFGWVIGCCFIDDEFGLYGCFIWWCFVVIGVFGVLLLTSGLLCILGYNWVNLVGLLFVFMGMVLVVMLFVGGLVVWCSCWVYIVVVVLAVGVWFIVLVKLLSALLYLVVVVVFVVPWFWCCMWLFVGFIVVWGLVWIVLGVVICFWFVSFLIVLVCSARFFLFDRNQTIVGAFRDVACMLKVVVHDLVLLCFVVVVVMVLVAVAAVVVVVCF